MILRAARPLDAGAVGALLTEFAAMTAWLPRLYSAAEDISHAGVMIARGWVTVADDDGKVAGFLAQSGAEINALYICSAYQRRGVGRRLIGAAKSGAERLELWTHLANTQARAFYKSEGFEESERSDGASTDERLPDVKLVWTKGVIA